MFHFKNYNTSLDFHFLLSAQSGSLMLCLYLSPTTTYLYCSFQIVIFACCRSHSCCPSAVDQRLTSYSHGPTIGWQRSNLLLNVMTVWSIIFIVRFLRSTLFFGHLKIRTIYYAITLMLIRHFIFPCTLPECRATSSDKLVESNESVVANQRFVRSSTLLFDYRGSHCSNRSPLSRQVDGIQCRSELL